MNKIKKLFNVRIWEKFDVKKNNKTYKNCYFDKDGTLHIPNTLIINTLPLTYDLLTSEAIIVKHENKSAILTGEEKEYLENIIWPFDVDYIIKESALLESAYFITIRLKKDEKCISLPDFPINSKMYKGMGADVPYLPEELGL